MNTEEKNRLKTRWAKLSVFSNAALVVFKLAVGLLSGSVSIIAESVHSANDLLASVIAFVAVKKSAVPPDEDHPFGHGKYENLSGLIESALIVAAGAVIIYQAVDKLRHPGEIALLDLGIAVMFVASAVNFFVSRKLMRVARETDSVAIETDGAHLLVDVYTSLGVMAGLVVIRITGLTILDPILSIAIAVYIVYLGIHLSIKSTRDLLDAALPAAEVEVIERIIRDGSHPVVSHHGIATRKAAGTRMIEAHLVVHRTATVAEGHAIAAHIRSDLQAEFPGARVMVHVDPCDPSCTTCAPTAGAAP